MRQRSVVIKHFTKDTQRRHITRREGVELKKLTNGTRTKRIVKKACIFSMIKERSFPTKSNIISVLYLSYKNINSNSFDLGYMRKTSREKNMKKALYD